MNTVAQAPTQHKRIAYHATLGDTHGTAIRTVRGEVYFLADDDRVTRLYDADIPALILHGRVDLSAEAKIADMHARTDLAILDAARMAA
jgi:hypothetical protein